MSRMSSRRAFLAAAIGTGASFRAFAQGPPPISPVPTPRDYSRGEPLPYPDPDIVALTPAFRRYIIFNTPIRRLHTGTLWAEGPAWNGVGKYLVWSDIPNNVQMRWLDDDARVTTFRSPAGNSNGNTFDYEGRQLSCEHGGRRVARYESNGSVTTIADRFDGKRLNSPNDVVVAPDGGIWFTDPSYGIRGNYEGARADSETKEAVYRVDGRTGQVRKVTRRSTSPIPAPAVRSRCGMSTGRPCATASATRSSPCRAATRRQPLTACAATPTATSGRERDLVCW
jgi:gluconolactonase